MSVQFGRWEFDGAPLDSKYFENVRMLLASYGPDGTGSYFKNNIGVLYHSFHTAKVIGQVTQPHILSSGAVLTWDGRLDNRADLIHDLRDVVTIASSDVTIVAAALDRWGTDSLSRFIGDWALAFWDPGDRSLLLAKDFVGTRQLYYLLDEDQITWSTILDPLVLLAGKAFVIDEEYIAGWLSFLPAAHLTPYVGIRSVPPSSYVYIKNRRAIIGTHWMFDPSKRVRYRADGEYEDHFRAVFSDSVRRRLVSDSPVLAELSGGIDSSSIVCVADIALAQGNAETPRLDTLSYYDDSEPNWNERPYFTRVERQRGRTGCHIDVSLERKLNLEFDEEHFAATPSSIGNCSYSATQFAAFMAAQGNRIVLSGIGGDEVLGGVPAPTPELTDLLATAHLHKLFRQLVAWAMVKREPLLHLIADTVRAFLPIGLAGVEKHKRPVIWLEPSFVRRTQIALRGYETRIQLLGPLPSFQENLRALEALRRQLACSTLSASPLHEKRYPYLDRDLLEFIFAIPREQVVRPHERRSLMRRAMRGIVPDELLNRKRKAFVTRGPMAVISEDWPAVIGLTQQMVSCTLGIVKPTALVEVLQKLRQGQHIAVVPVLRTLVIESWLRSLRGRNCLIIPSSAGYEPSYSVEPTRTT